MVILPRQAAEAKTDPPMITNVTPVGPLMVQPWGQTPKNSTFTKGLWTSNRDCGFSTPLSDGKRLWVFCDSTLYDQNKVMRSNSASNTAALASATDPMIVSDYLPWGNLSQFIMPQTFYPCDGGYRATWPSGAVTLPDIDNNPKTDRVVIMFQNNCIHPLGNNQFGLEYFDVGIAQFDYNADNAFVLKATVINPRLFPPSDGQDFQFGPVMAPDGFGNQHLYAYTCTAAGACFVKRVWITNNYDADKGKMGDPTWWESWSASGWSTSQPGVAMFSGGGAATATSDAINVAYVPAMGRYVMSYMPFPVGHHMAGIRTALRPEGPWSDPTTVLLPGCELDRCYAANVQTQFSDANTLGISYLKWNDFIGWRPKPTNQGRINVIKVPLTIPRTASVVQNNVDFVFEIHNGGLTYEYKWLGVWNKWFPLGTGVRTYIGQPAATVGADGMLDVVVTGSDGHLYHAHQSVGGTFGDPVPIATNVRASGEVAVVTLPNGCLDAYATDTTGRPLHVWQVLVNGTCTWSSLGLWIVPTASSFRAVRGIAAAKEQDGRVHLFGVDASGKVFHTWQSAPNSTEKWAGDFKAVYPTSGFKATRGIAATNETDGRIHLFAVDPYGQIFHTWQTTPNAPTTWSSLGFWLISGSSTPGGISASPGAGGQVALTAIRQDLMTEQRATEATAGTPSPLTAFSPF